MEQKQQLPNAAAVLVLGICSIVFSCLGVGLILGIIGLVLSSKGRKMYKANPALYDGNGTLTAGFVTSIIGTCIGGFWVMYYIIIVAIMGGVAFSMSNFGN
jgi:hypothetical protein